MPIDTYNVDRYLQFAQEYLQNAKMNWNNPELEDKKALELARAKAMLENALSKLDDLLRERLFRNP